MKVFIVTRYVRYEGTDIVSTHASFESAAVRVRLLDANLEDFQSDVSHRIECHTVLD